MQRTALTIAAAVLILGSSFAHGLWSSRWSGWAEQLEAAASKIAQVPETFGEWSAEAVEIEKQSMKMAGARGYVARRYTHRASGQSVVVMLLCGQSGPLAAHTPLICLPGSGMEMVGVEGRYTARRDETREWGEFLQADFIGSDAGAPLKIRLFWSWSPDAVNWQAPQHPRIAFGGKPYLFKIFVHRALDQRDAREPSRTALEEDPCAIFLRDFLPEVKRVVRAPAPGEKAVDEV
jgi:hypothetical protein